MSAHFHPLHCIRSIYGRPTQWPRPVQSRAALTNVQIKFRVSLSTPRQHDLCRYDLYCCRLGTRLQLTDSRADQPIVPWGLDGGESRNDIPQTGDARPGPHPSVVTKTVPPSSSGCPTPRECLCHDYITRVAHGGRPRGHPTFRATGSTAYLEDAGTLEKQPQWSPETSIFYISVPEFGSDPTVGDFQSSA